MSWLHMGRKLARLINVDLTHSQSRYFQKLCELFPAGGRWLDVGCGHQIVPVWAGSKAEQRRIAETASLFVGADLDPSIRKHALLQHGVFASANQLPFAHRTFDFVTANMVVEHLEDPESVFREVRESLRPGGQFLFHTPNYYYYGIFIASLVPDGVKKKIIRLLERREDEDIFHTYYRANTVQRTREILTQTGFDDIQISTTPLIAMFQFLGPIGVIEIPWIKLVNWTNLTIGRPTLIVSARRSQIEPRP